MEAGRGKAGEGGGGSCISQFRQGAKGGGGGGGGCPAAVCPYLSTTVDFYLRPNLHFTFTLPNSPPPPPKARVYVSLHSCAMSVRVKRLPANLTLGKRSGGAAHTRGRLKVTLQLHVA